MASEGGDLNGAADVLLLQHGHPLDGDLADTSKGKPKSQPSLPHFSAGPWEGDRGQYPLEMDGNPAPSPTCSCDAHLPPLLPPTAATFQLGICPAIRTHGPTLPILQRCQCGWHISQPDTCPRLPGRTLPSAPLHQNWWRWRLLELAC